MVKKYYSDGKPEFNSAVPFIMRIDKNCKFRDEASITGDVVMWYRACNNILANVGWKLLKIDKEKLGKEPQEVIDELKHQLRIISQNLKNTSRQTGSATIEHAENLLTDFDFKLNYYLDLAGFLFPDKQYLSFEEEIEADFQ